MARKKIIIVDSSKIIRQGIATLLRNASCDYEVTDRIDFNLMDTYKMINAINPDIVIINPAISINNYGERLIQLREYAINQSFKLVALVYAYFDEYVLSMFDETIFINDDEDKIVQKIHALTLADKSAHVLDGNQHLSHRELDVLKLISLGFSNREVADELCISVHTVVSHRKNITSKLGIKSTSGLTLYAVSNKLISTEDLARTI